MEAARKKPASSFSALFYTYNMIYNLAGGRMPNNPPFGGRASGRFNFYANNGGVETPPVQKEKSPRGFFFPAEDTPALRRGSSLVIVFWIVRHEAILYNRSLRYPAKSIFGVL
jgi:hypothetical protein